MFAAVLYIHHSFIWERFTEVTLLFCLQVWLDGPKAFDQEVWVCVLSRSVMFDSMWLYGLQPTRLLCPWDSPGKNPGVRCHALLQGIFQTQGSNPGLLCLLLIHWGNLGGDIKYLDKLRHISIKIAPLYIIHQSSAEFSSSWVPIKVHLDRLGPSFSKRKTWLVSVGRSS